MASFQLCPLAWPSVAPHVVQVLGAVQVASFQLWVCTVSAGTVGVVVGAVVGFAVALVVAAVVGVAVGLVVGAVVGLVVGLVIGTVVGAEVGAVAAVVEFVVAVVDTVVSAGVCIEVNSLSLSTSPHPVRPTDTTHINASNRHNSFFAIFIDYYSFR